MAADVPPPESSSFLLTFDHIWQAILTIGVAFFGWRHTEHRKEIDGMKQQIASTQKSLDEHKLYAAETFATSEEVGQSIDKAEKRLGEQIKQNHEHTLERLDDIRDRLPRRN